MNRLAHSIASHIVAVVVCASPAVEVAARATGRTSSVVPVPVSVEHRDGSFLIEPSTQVVAEDSAAAEASKLIAALAPAMGYRLRLANDSRTPQAGIRLDGPVREDRSPA